MRKEKDALGEVLVPDDKYYGAQTQRALENFDVGNEYFPAEFIRAHALVKKAAALVNGAMDLLDGPLADSITRAADEVIAGKLDGHFPLVIWQSGSGTQFNMNMNEVIANRAIELMSGELGSKIPIHPNDHVNMSQSTNDTIPTAMHIAAVSALNDRLFPSLKALARTFDKKSEEFCKIIKIGRTHLQDATPLTMGQEFSGYAAQLQQSYRIIEQSLEHLYELPIGATAVGTGINSPKGFDVKMVEQINKLTGHSFQAAKNKFAGLAAHDAVVACSGSLKILAAALLKIANDIRWLASGPRCGLGEITLPANEPGSSIMPGKVNPSQCEMVSMVVCQVYGNDTAIALAGSQGNFELNVHKPLMAHNLLQSINLLSDALQSFNKRCIAGIKAHEKRINENLHNSLMLATALNQHIGYDQAAEIALQAWREDMTLKESALKLGYVTSEQFDAWVAPEKMIKPTNPD